MIRLLADEDFKGYIVKGILKKAPGFDIKTIQNLGLSGITDNEVIYIANSEKRIILSHDRNTFIGTFKNVAKSKSLTTGLWIVKQSASIGVIVKDIILVSEISQTDEWFGMIEYLPIMH